ncbi:MAG: N-acetylmuramoyl-L-alanine amidase [Acidobacteriota bacterium]
MNRDGIRTSPVRRIATVAMLLCLISATVPPTRTRADATDAVAAERIDRSPPARTIVSEGIGAGMRVVVIEGGNLRVEVRVQPRDTYASLGRRYLIDLRELAALRTLNGEKLPEEGAAVAIPYASLNDKYKVRAIRGLFPQDGTGNGDWVHRVGAGLLPAAEESLWHIALWLTGRGENFAILADRNNLPGLAPQAGQMIRIPGELLLPPFARLVGLETARGITTPSEEAFDIPDVDQGDGFTEVEGEPEETPSRPTSTPGRAVPPAEGAELLTYGKDAQGRHAVYRLRRGEALYTAVVIRYTGRVDASEVNDLAAKIATRSRIKDVTDIPVGFRIKIPLDALTPEYLPPDDERRIAWERGQADVTRHTNRARSDNLRGVAVILDAGHGGRDIGASHNGVWEHDYVYDVLARIKARLEKETGARVLTTIKDRKEGYTIYDRRRLPRSQAEILLTHPPFALQQRAPGVNLRWYLANSYYRALVAEGFDPLKIVFTSLHADARHPSLGGAMVYVPGEEYRRGRYGHKGAVYTRRKEVRQQQYVSFTRSQRVRSEGLSREFASILIQTFKKHDVPVHPYGPIRERIIRRGRSFVPAVLRCNQVPVEVLIEMNNLNNRADSRLLREPAHRQRVADAYVAALQLYYDGSRKAPRSARTRR